jgi:hypothetical protein
MKPESRSSEVTANVHSYATARLTRSHGKEHPRNNKGIVGNITFLKHIKYLSVIFDKRITLRLHMEMTEAKAFRTFIRLYSLFKMSV